MIFNPMVYGGSQIPFTYVQPNEFRNNSSITKIDSSHSKANAFFILSAAFMSCRYLSYVSFPECQTIGAWSVFYSDYSLRTAYLPKCSKVGESAFTFCYNLSNLILPECDYVGASAFWACGLSASGGTTPNILKNIAENLSYIPMGGFGYTRLSSDLSLTCESIGGYAFDHCSYIQTLNLSNCHYIGQAAFEECYSLNTIYIPNVKSISAWAFIRCSSLSSVYITNVSSVPTAGSVIFNGTKIASNSGYIYVPRSLYNAFRVASNWSKYSTRFVSV